MNVFSQRCGRLVGRLLALSLCLACAAPPLMAQEYGIIDDVRISRTAQGPAIRISFTRTAQYLGHTPKEQSRQLFIDLRLISTTGEIQVPQPQQLRFTPTAEVPLTTVSYREEIGDQVRLELNFTTPVRYQIEPFNDYRGVTVTLIGDKTPQKVPQIEHEPLASPEVEKKVDALMEEARKELVDERNYRRAIFLYQQVLNQPRNSRSRLALELLGLARERAGQRSEARSVYSQYLKRYPSGEGSERVRQRLMSLETAALAEKKELRETRKEGEVEWEVYGALSQFYLHDAYSVDDAPGTTTASALTTDLDLNALRRAEGSDTRMRVTAGHYLDLIDNDNRSYARVGSLFVEHHDRDIGWWGRAGRQTSSRDGVLGRFDGVKLGYNISKRVEASIVAGYPVDSSRDPIDDSRTLTGLAFDLGPYADHWEFSLYGLEQTVDTLIDRRAVGGEMRYFRQDLMVLSLTDYDVFHQELNIGRVLANWTWKNNLTVNASYDVRKTPTLTTRNALIGQTAEDMAQLRTLYTDDEIYQMAPDRTAELSTTTLGVSQALSERLRLAADLSYMHTTTTKASFGVQPVWPTNDYGINLQAIGTGVLNGDDITSAGLRYSDGTTVKSSALYASTRLPVGTHWRFYPRLMLSQRTWKTGNQHQVIIGPVVRTEYRLDKITFEAELGSEWTNHEMPDVTEHTRDTFGSVSYHLEF